MEQSEEFGDDRASTKVRKLQIALWQASRVRNRKLDTKLKQMGFKRFLILLNDQRLVASIKQQLSTEFEL